MKLDSRGKAAIIETNGTSLNLVKFQDNGRRETLLMQWRIYNGKYECKMIPVTECSFSWKRAGSSLFSCCEAGFQIRAGVPIAVALQR
jgi:hypothetical protein